MASIAKSMTVIAAMQLVEQNHLNINVLIQVYIPDYPRQRKTLITERHWVSQASRINRYKNANEAENQDDYLKLSDAVDIFKNLPLLFEPGTEYVTQHIAILFQGSSSKEYQI